VVIYDPISGHDRFGKLIIKNLKRAGIAGGVGGGNQKRDDDKHVYEDWREQLLSLEGMRTLTDHRFDVALVRPDDWERTMRCKALDELEEFSLLIRHCFCLLMGVATLLSYGCCVSASPGCNEDGIFCGMVFPDGIPRRTMHGNQETRLVR
jgi:hypothetical protein